MRRRLLVVALASLFLLTGCLSSGTVVAKAHDDAKLLPVVENECNGSYGCTVHTRLETVPECWRLDLRQGNDTGHVCVDEETWKRVAIGSYWHG